MSLLRNLNFSILFSGQLVSTFGNNLFMLALPWFVYLLTGSKADLALVGFAQSLPIIAGLFSGVFVDRWKKRSTMIWSDLIRCLISVAVFFFAIFHASFWYIAAMVLLLEFIGTFFSPASAALLPLVVGEEQVPQAMGLQQSGNASVQLLGQFGGGTLLSLFGAPILFLLNAASFLISVFSLGWLRAPEPMATNVKHSFMKEWQEGFRAMIQSRMLMLFIMGALVANFAMAPFDIVMTAWVKGPLHENAFWLGAIGGAFFIGMMLGGISLTAVMKVFNMKNTVMLGLIASGVITGAVGIDANAFLTVGLIFVGGWVNGIVNGALGAGLIHFIPKDKRGRIIGTAQTLGKLANPLGLAVFGGLMVILPLSVILYLMGIIAVLSGLTFLLPVQDDLDQMNNTASEELSL